MYIRTILFLLLVVFAACSEDDNRPPTVFEATVDSLRASTAKIIWETPIDPEGDEVFFDIYLEGQLISSQLEPYFIFTNLQQATLYSGEVVAFDRDHNKTSAAFSFKTYSERIYTETFDDPTEWDITIQKNSVDTRSRAEFTSGQLFLIVGTHDDYTQYGAQATAKKTMNEFDILDFKVISEIKIQVEFNAFYLRTFYNPDYHRMRLKFGPYTIYQRTHQPHSDVPGVAKFTFITTVPKNNLYNATSIADRLYITGGRFSRPITSYNAEFDISATEFNAHPIVEFSAATGNAGGPGGGYPAYSNTLVVKSIVITVTGEPAI